MGSGVRDRVRLCQRFSSELLLCYIQEAETPQFFSLISLLHAVKLD